MSIWRVQLLGPFCVQREETTLSRFSTHNAAALLAYLALNFPNRFPREFLIELLWPDADLPAGRNRLSYTLSTLRRQLESPPLPTGSVLLTTHHDIGLHPESVSSDAVQFQALSRTLEKTSLPSRRLDLLLEALALYRGEMLPGFYEEWALAARRRFSAAFVEMAEETTRLLQAQGKAAQALLWAQRVLEADPLQESAHYTVIRLYMEMGRHAEALGQYEALERMLHEECQATPSAALQRVATSLRARPMPLRKGEQGPDLRVDVPDTPDEPEVHPPCRSLPVPAPAPFLPGKLTRFFGQEEALARLREALTQGHRRLFTLTGPGGSGKTRLATECARRLLASFENTVAFVPLVEVTDPARIPDAILIALRLPHSPQVEAFEQICFHLQGRRALLVLDNFEHLVEGGAEVVQALLVRLPELHCLLTSRRLLNLEGEQEMQTPLLPLPPLGASGEELAGHACVELFVDRVQARRPGFGVTQQNTALLGELMRKLEGVPLAIELAAAQMRMGTLGQVFGRLEHRLDALSSPNRDTPERHRTLRAAVEGSYRLLDPALQRLFRALSVFRGGWTVEAAEAICGSRGSGVGYRGNGGMDDTRHPTPETLELLQQLREHSLIGAEERDGELRFGMLETLWEYASERLTESGWTERLQERHVRYFLSLAEKADSLIRGPQQHVWLSRLEAERDNFRAALSMCQREERLWTSGLRLSGALAWFWYRRGELEEGETWLERFLERTEAQGETRERARALVGAGIIRYYRQDRPKSVRLLSEATRIYRRLGDARGVADSLIYQSISAVLVGDAQSEPMIRECVALWREMEDDRWRLALALWAQGAVWMTQERYDEAKAPLEESRALYEEIGDAWGIGAPLRLLGAIAASRGDLEAACRLLSQAVAAAREASDPWRLAYFSGCLGYELCTLGRYEEAAEAYEQCLALREQLGLRSDIFHAHIFLGRVRRSLRQWEESRRAYLCALEYARDLQRHPPWVGSPFDRRHVFGAEPRPSQSDIPLLDHLIAEAKQALRDMENPGSG